MRTTKNKNLTLASAVKRAPNQQDSIAQRKCTREVAKRNYAEGQGDYREPKPGSSSSILDGVICTWWSFLKEYHPTNHSHKTTMCTSYEIEKK
jgi:hypothetical protein